MYVDIFSDVFRRNKDIYVSFTYTIDGKKQQGGEQQDVIAALPSLRIDPERFVVPFDVYSKNMGTVVLGLQVAGYNVTESR